MIVILNGTLGVGKTEVAWKLIEKFDRAVMLGARDAADHLLAI